MKCFSISTLLLLFCIFLWTSCSNEKVGSGFDFDFDAIDKEANKINLDVRSHYTLTAGYLKKLENKYGSHYNDSLLVPAVISISREILKEYSAGDIYNYKRQEIEQKLGGQIRINLASLDIEMDDFFISSVNLPEELMRRLQEEHVERLKDNNKTDN